MSVTRLAVILFVLINANTVGAHEWYPLDCCSGHDCHPVACETLTERPSGAVMYAPAPTIFFRQKVFPSLDERCHICTSEADGSGVPYCVFIRPHLM